MQDNEPPFRITWDNNKWHYLLTNGDIGNETGRIYGSYNPFFASKEKNDLETGARVRAIARGHEGTLFFYNLGESFDQKIPFQLAVRTISESYDAIPGRNLEPVSYPFLIRTNKQVPIIADLLETVIAEAKKRGLIDIVSTFRKGDTGIYEGEFIVPVQLYRKIQV